MDFNNNRKNVFTNTMHKLSDSVKCVSKTFTTENCKNFSLELTSAAKDGWLESYLGVCDALHSFRTALENRFPRLKSFFHVTCKAGSSIGHGACKITSGVRNSCTTAGTKLKEMKENGTLEKSARNISSEAGKIAKVSGEKIKDLSGRIAEKTNFSLSDMKEEISDRTRALSSSVSTSCKKNLDALALKAAALKAGIEKKAENEKNEGTRNFDRFAAKAADFAAQAREKAEGFVVSGNTAEKAASIKTRISGLKDGLMKKRENIITNTKNKIAAMRRTDADSHETTVENITPENDNLRESPVVEAEVITETATEENSNVNPEIINAAAGSAAADSYLVEEDEEEKN